MCDVVLAEIKATAWGFSLNQAGYCLFHSSYNRDLCLKKKKAKTDAGLMHAAEHQYECDTVNELYFWAT